jgi:capsule polysaccharide export protein KpsE/RkpR
MSQIDSEMRHSIVCAVCCIVRVSFNLQKQPQAKQTGIKCQTETGKQITATVVRFTTTEEPEIDMDMVAELREKLTQLQATVERQRKTEEANNHTIQQLREKQQQLQETIDEQTKTVEATIQSQQQACPNTTNVST